MKFIKGTYTNSTASITLDEERLTAFPLFGNKEMMSLVTTLIPHRSGSSSYCNKVRVGKSIQIVKEEIKLPLFTNNMIIYVENPKESTKENFLEVIREFSKVAQHIKIDFVSIY